MTNNKKLTASEILRALADRKMLSDDISIFQLIDGYVGCQSLMDDNPTWQYCASTIEDFLEKDLYIYTPPEPKKTLSDKWVDHCRKTSNFYSGGQSFTDKQVYNWLKDNEDDISKTNE